MLKRVYELLSQIPLVAEKVGDNIHLQYNDAELNDYKLQDPMITYADIDTKISKVKSHLLVQITARSKSKFLADEIANAIIGGLDQYSDTQYRYSFVSQKTPIYDQKEKYNGYAVTLSVISRKSQMTL